MHFLRFGSLQHCLTPAETLNLITSQNFTLGKDTHEGEEVVHLRKIRIFRPGL